jgi:NADH-quinone oxidoreductase subunit J
MSWSLLFFIAVGAVSLVSAVGVVSSRVPVHSALFLLVNFSSLAVLYIMLDAQFLAAAQVIIYAGGIVILILFVIMLMGSEPVEERPSRRSWISYTGVALGLVLLASIAASLLAGGIGDAVQPTAIQAGIPEAVGFSLYTEYILPFELVAILLLVALIGALLLARRFEPHP